MTRAAEVLHVTQPTLSKALKTLEEELGKKLFIRHSFSIRLTEEGVLLRNRAEDLIGMADKIEQEFHITSGDTEQVADKLDKGLWIFWCWRNSRTAGSMSIWRFLKRICGGW